MAKHSALKRKWSLGQTDFKKLNAVLKKMEAKDQELYEEAMINEKTFKTIYLEHKVVSNEMQKAA